ncbi:MAG: MFS transporter [Bacteroidales bacterium]|nr:MFS transporter [Bacteroidales bacterium]
MKIKNKKFWLFILLIGFVSLFSDMVYESGKSLYGPFLKMLEASSFTLGFFTGLGEFLGYALRYIFGRIADKTGKYWHFVFLGYMINLFSVPFLAFIDMWEWAVIIIMLERVGKAMRAPSRDALLSTVTAKVGHGKGFAIQEILDQIGATAGPLLMTFALLLKNSYHITFALLFIPATLSILFLLWAHEKYPIKSEEIYSSRNSQLTLMSLRKPLWFYMIGIAFVAIGFADFPLVGYHIKTHNVFGDSWIPALYAMIMLVDGISAFGQGWAFDKWGIRVLFIVSLINPIIPWLIFSIDPLWILIGMIGYGISLGAQESIFKSYLASQATDNKATLFGFFHMIFGLSWFLGSAIASYLYSYDRLSMILFLSFAQIVAIVFFYLLSRRSV